MSAPFKSCQLWIPDDIEPINSFMMCTVALMGTMKFPTMGLPPNKKQLLMGFSRNHPNIWATPIESPDQSHWIWGCYPHSCDPWQFFNARKSHQPPMTCDKTGPLRLVISGSDSGEDHKMLSQSPMHPSKISNFDPVPVQIPHRISGKGAENHISPATCREGRSMKDHKKRNPQIEFQF